MPMVIFLPNIVADIDDHVDGYGVVRLEEAIELRKISKRKFFLCKEFTLKKILLKSEKIIFRFSYS